MVCVSDNLTLTQGQDCHGGHMEALQYLSPSIDGINISMVPTVIRTTSAILGHHVVSFDDSPSPLRTNHTGPGPATKLDTN
jgi:hypothetical protein